MKALFVFVLVVGTAALAVAQPDRQSAYSVPGDSRGNSITLTVVNDAPGSDVRDVAVSVERVPAGVSFHSRSVMVKAIAAGKEAETTFLFDVGKDVKANKKDTVEFVISDAQGILGVKSIIVSFAGPTVYTLDQNFPNPFNPVTTIHYQLPVDSRVSIIVYDILGREVRALVNEAKPAGFYSVQFDARNIASGAYFYRMLAVALTGKGSYSSVKKIMVLK